MTPRFLKVEEVIALHGEALQLYGGHNGVRDNGLLESAVGQPGQTFDGCFLYSTLSDMAARYWYGIVLNHPFIDGNKRTGLRSAIVFLALNGIEFQLSEDDAINLTLGIIDHSINFDDLVSAIKVGCEPFTQ